MNERIKELIEQAGIESYPAKLLVNTDKEGKVSSKWEIPLEKFTDLIIKECITQIALIGISNFENDEHGDIGWTVDTSIEMIKEHFGVEE